MGVTYLFGDSSDDSSQWNLQCNLFEPIYKQIGFEVVRIGRYTPSVLQGKRRTYKVLNGFELTVLNVEKGPSHTHIVTSTPSGMR